ncbi:sigma-70 family RNA polymerase sigma factor [Oceanibacterium hippocampi]|nr:sigma-70 family RNA polymerase sigma factor [Oceanibacterium hippocampi]
MRAARPGFGTGEPSLTAVMMNVAAGAPENPVEDRLCDCVEAIAAAGDRAAFAELFEHFAPRLKAFVMRAGADPETAEELMQEAMIAVWRKAASFDRSRASASTWIFTIVRNKRIDRFRRASRPQIDPAEVELMTEAVETPDMIVARGQAEARLRDSLTSLSEEQISVIRKAFFEDKSHSVISDELGLPLGTVKSRIRLALARLRLILEPES